MSSIALVDANNFYVSCEQVFNPKLRDKAVVVLSIMTVVPLAAQTKPNYWV